MTADPRIAKIRQLVSQLVALEQPTNTSVDRADDLDRILDDLSAVLEKHKHTEAALNQYRTIVETSLEGIWLIDANAVTTYVNPRMAEMLGYRTDEMLGRSLFEFMDDAGRAEANHNMERRQKGIREQHDFRFKHKSGADMWTSITTNPIMDAQGQLVSALAMVTDITERRRSEEALRESEMFLRKSQTVGRIGSFYYDFQREVWATSPTLDEIFGIDASFPRTRSSWLQIVHPDDLDAVVAMLSQQLIRDQQRFEREYQIVRQDTHETRWVYSVGEIELGEGGNPARIAGTIQDITDRKRAEARQQATTSGLRTVLAIANDLMLCPDIDTTLRQAVELARGALGIERCGLFLVEERTMQGTYGTDGHGNTTDEHGLVFPLTESWAQRVVGLKRGDARWLVLEEMNQTYWDGATHRIVGKGWLVMTPIPLPDGRYALMFNDTNISRRPIDETQQEVLSVYCSILGAIIGRRRSETALYQSEQRLQQAVQAAVIGIFEHDHRANTIYWSPEKRAIFGFGKDEPVTMEMYLDQVHPEDRERIRAAIEAAHDPAGNGHFDVEHRILTRDGELRWVSVRSTTFFEGEGEARQPRYTVGATIDTTERRRTEIALHDSEMFLRRSQQVGRTGSYYLDIRAGTWISSPMLDEIYGIDATFPREIESWISLIHPDNKAEMAHKLSVEVLSKRTRYTAEYRIIRHDTHETRWVSTLGEVERDERGQPVRAIGTVQDITDRKLAEAQQQAIIAGLRAILAATIELLSCPDLDSTLRQAVELARNSLGIERCGLFFERSESMQGTYGTDAAGRTTEESGLRISLDQEWRKRILALKTGDARWLILKDDRHTYWDGEKRIAINRGWVVVTLVPLAGGRNAFMFNDSAITDAPLDETKQEIFAVYCSLLGAIIDRRQSVTARHHSEEMYRSLVENSPDLIMNVGTDYRIQFINRLTPGTQVVGTSILDYIPAEFQDIVKSALERAVSTRQTVAYELQAPGEDGMPHWFQSRLVPTRQNEHSIGLTLIATDITERKVAEDKLRRSELLYRALVSNAPGMTFTLFNKENRFLLVEGDATQAIGLTKANAEGKTVAEVVPAHLVKGVEATIEQVFRGETHTEERTVSGGTVINTFVPVRDDQGHIIAGLGIAQDITQRKRMEEDIRNLNADLERRVAERTAELQAANEEIKQFAYIVSHDMRAPLVNLKGFAAELRYALQEVNTGCAAVSNYLEPELRERIAQALHHDIPEALQFIESSVTHMDGFTRAILKLSRMGRQNLDIVNIDVKAVVDNILSTLAYQIAQNKVNVIIGDLPSLQADLVSIEQIFGNILTNAILYLDPGRPGQIEVNGERTAQETIYRIRDNGRGIAKEDLDKVFAPFRRAGKQNVPGEGMGMAYVQTLVRRHSGRILCESDLGVGTTFTFTIAHPSAGGWFSMKNG